VPRAVGLVASPRRGRNTDTLVGRALDGARSQGLDVEKIFLNDLTIKPCQACGHPPHPHHCHLEDDMGQVYRALETADVVIVGTPAYYGTYSAQLKLVIDRSSCLVRLVESADGRAEFVRRLTKTSEAPRGGAGDPEVLAQAFQLGRRVCED